MDEGRDWMLVSSDGVPGKGAAAAARVILARAACGAGVSVGDLASPSRRAGLVLARDRAAAQLRDGLGWSYERIGRALGGRDHSTVRAAVARGRCER